MRMVRYHVARDAYKILCFLASVLTLAFFVSCSTGKVTEYTSDLEDPIRATLQFTVDGMPVNGSALVQRKTSMNIVLNIPKGAVKLEIRSCHRRKIISAPETPFKYRYIPMAFIENWESCVLQFLVTTKNANLIKGILDFSSNESLDADLQCDAEDRNSGGLRASFCQAGVGLHQRISFGRTISAYADEGCAAMTPEGLSAFTWRMSKGFCVYYFRTQEGKDHRLTTYGWASDAKEY